MSRDTIYAPGPSGDLITDRVARRISVHPRVATVPAPPVAPVASLNPAPTAQLPSPTAAAAGGARILRRWSVAGLIAHAAIGQPVIA